MKIVILLPTLLIGLLIYQITGQIKYTCNQTLFNRLRNPTGIISSENVALDFFSTVLATNKSNPHIIANQISKYNMEMATFIISRIHDDYKYRSLYQKIGQAAI